MFRGRKVKDPVVHGANTAPRESRPGLSKAWDTVGKAKSELRKIEQRLGDAERRQAPTQLNETEETPITDYRGLPANNVDANETFDVQEPHAFASGAVVDNYGRSAYLRSKAHGGTSGARKVSRLDDKYKEELEHEDKKVSSKSRDARPSESGAKLPKRPDFQLRVRNHDPATDHMPSGSRALGEKRVEFMEPLKGRENHMDNNYAGSHPVGNHRSISPTFQHSTLTDSRDIRETDINFLNNDLTARDTDVRWAQQPLGSRLTHVSVTVPDTKKTMSSNKYSSADPVHNPPVAAGSGKRQAFLDLISENHIGDELERRSNNSDCSYSDSESGRRRFKGDIRNIDADGLAKLKETIRKQIKSNPRDHAERKDEGPPGSVGAADGDKPSRYLHDAFDPIMPRSQEVIEGAEKHVKVRKVAAGPAAPKYRGFSEAEVKYRVVEKVPKPSQDARRKEKKRQISVKLQDRRLEALGNWLSVEEDKAGDKKKVTRVIAPSRKPTKQQPQPKKEIITTSSWRAGQELILRELGPAKGKKSTSKTKDTREYEFDEADVHDDRASPMEERPEALVGEEYPGLGVGSATAAELECHKALSEEAKRVYSDLQLDSEEERKRDTEDNPKKAKSPVKRKAPRSSEPEKQQPSAKHRHYDQDDIRRYMQRQKALRMRQQRDQELRQREVEEGRRRQLEDLYSKQKSVPTTSSSKNRKESKGPPRSGQDTFVRPASFGDIDNPHPFLTDRNKFLGSGEFDFEKENVNFAEQDMELSDGSSTITGDGSMDEGTPIATPRVPKVDIVTEGLTNKTGNSLPNKNSKTERTSKGMPEAQSNVKTIGGFSFDKDGVMSKFSQALQEKLNEEPRGISGSGGSGGYHSNSVSREPPQGIPSAFSGVNFNSDSGTGQSRVDRIRAIKETAATLQNRIQAEARKIQTQSSSAHNNEHGATSMRPGVRWRDQNEEPDFVSRFEQVTAARDDYTVFRSNLPGSQPSVRFPEGVPKPDTTAGAAQRSHPRQGLPTSGHRADEDNQDIGEDSTITETSTFSEITETDDSDNDLETPANRKIGAGLKTDFHSARSALGKPGEPKIPRPTHQASTQSKPRNSWDESDHDPYNVFSIYSRRQQEKFSKGSRDPSGKTEETRKKPSAMVEEDEVRTELPQTQSFPAASAKAAMSAERSGSPVVAARTESPARRSPSPYGVSSSQASAYSSAISSMSKSEPVPAHSATDKSRSRQTAVSFKPVENHASDEDTLEEESYTQSFETEEERKSRSKSAVDKLPQSHSSLPSHKERADVADTSDDDEDLVSHEAGYRRETSAPAEEPESGPRVPGRLSPNSLERRFFAELNQLDSMETSMRQVTGVERTRAVAMSQQETVSLAQMLKARQQAHDLKMKELQMKVQHEAVEASKHLEDARKRASDAAINAADMIARVRGEGVSAMQDSTRKLIDTQTEAAKATAEAAKFLAEARAYGMQDTNRLAVETAAAAAASAVNTALEKQWQQPRQSGPASEHKVSRGKGGAAQTTAKRPTSGDSDGSVSGADGHDEGSVNDYSVTIDESMTEEEVEERSFRVILPSESHRKKAKHLHSDNESVASEVSMRGHFDELNSLFAGEESFDKFTDEMVKQFIKKEELRAQHQASLLRVREKALLEKTKAEISWLDQQKQRMRNKGADDNYPMIKKKQRGLKMKLQEQQAEIRRLREENIAASKERQRLLQEEIAKKRQQAAPETKQKSKPTGGRLGRPNEVHTEAEVSSIDEASDAEKRQRKDYKSDSEIYTEPKASGKKYLDERFLTHRQRKLLERRKNAEELLNWKKRLDDEESRVFRLEKKALKAWNQEGAAAAGAGPQRDDTETKNSTRKETTREVSKDKLTAQDTTIISDQISTARDESMYTRSAKESPVTQSVSTEESSPEEIHRRRLNDKSNLKNFDRSGSESSIPEDVSQSSEDTTLGGSKKISRLSYGSETFENTTVTTREKSLGLPSPKSPLEKLPKFKKGLSSPRSIRSITRNSESESEDSISYTETQSDVSDFEGRIRALNEELRRRKTEADRLKRERKKKKRESMKTKEESLKKQIEAYDNQISQLKGELQKEMEHEPVKGGVRPQIKQPKVSPPKTMKKPEVTPPKQKVDLESSDSSPQVSPIVQEDKDKKSAARVLPVPVRQGLDRISEGSESPTLQSERSDLSRSPKPTSTKAFVAAEVSGQEEKTDEISEEIETVSEASEEKSFPKIIGKGDIYDVSYTEDFVTEPITQSVTLPEKMPLSARSQVSDTDTRNAPLSARTDSEEKPPAHSISEQISEHITENFSQQPDSYSESFIKPLNMKEDLESFIQEDRSEELDEPSSYSPTTRSDSRPSSEHSVRSMRSSSEQEELSESERSQEPSLHDVTEKSVKDEVSEPSVRSRTGLISGTVFDIDDLLGMPGEDEDLTPVPSPKEVQKEDRFFIDALADFNVGDRVSVTGPNGARNVGTLLFKGNVQFAPGIWAGVELDRPIGRHDGCENDRRYFTCRPLHGVLVPGDDLMQALDEPSKGPLIDLRSSIDSQESDRDSFTDTDLNFVINEADQNVQEFDFDGSPLPSPGRSPRMSPGQRNLLADKLTDDLLQKVIKENVEKIGNIAAKQQSKRSPPPVASKPKTRPDSSTAFMNGDDGPVSPERESKPVKEAESGGSSDGVVTNLMNDAIDHMLDIRKNREKTTMQSPWDSGNYHDDGTDGSEPGDQAVSPTEEILVITKKDDAKGSEAPLRPGSPIPGLQQNSQDQSKDSGTEFEEEDNWPPSKAPPPYPGTEFAPSERSEISRSELQKLTEELFFAVPHKDQEVSKIVGTAVDAFWTQRRYGESLEGVAPPDSYFSKEESGTDLISNSKRVFKRLLFDLTGEVIRDIYKEEEYDSPLPWHKPKRKQNKYFKGNSLPTTVDVLKPVVQEAVVDILGLNGAQKSQRGGGGRWGIRKQKDLVDNILTQELREEEPQWVNYDDDELAVKMQLTETIFESLLTDTVQTMNKIFRRKQISSQAEK